MNETLKERIYRIMHPAFQLWVSFYGPVCHWWRIKRKYKGTLGSNPGFPV